MRVITITRNLLAVGIAAGLGLSSVTANAAKLTTVPRALRGTWVTHYRGSQAGSYAYGVEIFTAKTYRERMGQTKVRALHAKNKSWLMLSRQLKNHRTFTLTKRHANLWTFTYKLNEMAFPKQTMLLKRSRVKGQDRLTLTAYNPARTTIFTKVTR